MAIGSEIGRGAWNLFPGGVEVREQPWEHGKAVETTRNLIADKRVPAIFEAGFESHGVRIRVDILERAEGGWRLHEVKGATKLKHQFLPDISVQAFVCEETGLPVISTHLLHVNNRYIRASGEIAWREFFQSTDVTDPVKADLPRWPDVIRAQHNVISGETEPDVPPGKHYFQPYECEFIDGCSQGKPADWVLRLPRISNGTLGELVDMGIDAISDIPDDFHLTASQQRVRDCIKQKTVIVSSDLGGAVAPLGPPADYLDFETFNPGIPIYPGTRPYQTIPFQWSLHRVNRDGTVSHFEYLAEGDVDPRPKLARRLVECLSETDYPIITYTSFEKTRLTELAGAVCELSGSLKDIIGRLADLHAVISPNLDHPDFLGCKSLKSVAPALVPELGYSDLEVSDGSAASAAFYGIATGRLDAASESETRENLLAYCARDTLAMVEVHRAIRALQ